jgi:MFS family permease
VSAAAVATRGGWSDFHRFWLSESVSLIGSQVTALALPLAAVTVLGASGAGLGLVNAAGFAPFLVLPLLAGALIDRHRRRPVLIWSNVVRAAVLCLVPALAHAGALTLGALCLVAAVAGTATVFFDLAMHAYVPELVAESDLVAANSRLYGSVSVAQVAGPALAGLLVEAVGAAAAVLVDAASFVVSVALLLTIRTPERPVTAAGAGRRDGIGRSIADGLAFTVRHPYLRPCAVYAGAYNLCWMALQTAFLLYAVRVLQFGAARIGAVLAVAAIGSVAGSLAAGRFARRAGVGPAVLAATGLACLSPVLVPLAGGPPPVLLAVLTVAFLLGDLGSAVANIHVASLRQRLTPARMLGRMTAAYRLISWGTMPVGALAGGALAAAAGPRAALAGTAAGFLVAFAVIAASPVPALKDPA